MQRTFFKDKKRNLNGSFLTKKNSKILYYHNGLEQIWNIPHISDSMYVLGNYLNDNFYPYVKTKIKLPSGEHDLDIITQRLNGIEPDVLIINYEPSNCLLINIKKFKGVRVVVLGDYHHMYKNLEKIINYISNENFDLCFLGDLRMVPYIRSSIKSKILFSGNLITCGTSLSPVRNYKKKILHLGQNSQFHIKRGQVLSDLMSLKVPIDDLNIEIPKVPINYNKYAAVLNISLNFEWNERWLKVMESGGVLISDKLSKDNGVSKVYSEEEVPTFSSIEEAYIKLNKIFTDEEFRFETALKAQKKYKQFFDREITLERFWDAINGRNFDDFFNLNSDKFKKIYINKRNNYYWENIKLFQIIQECIRVSRNVRIDFYELEKENFPSINTLEIEEVNYIDEINKINHSKFDCNIIVSSKFIKRVENYDLIILKNNNKNEDLDGYEIVDVDEYFICYKRKRNLALPITHKFIKKDEKSDIDDNEFQYEYSFINKILSENFYTLKNKILLIGGLFETNEKICKKYNNIYSISFSELEKKYCLYGKIEVFDIIIFLDKSNSPSQLHQNLQKIYSNMNLNSVLFYHSTRFPLGPLGWKFSYPSSKDILNNDINPWQHYYDTKIEFGEYFNIDKFNMNLLSVFEKNHDITSKNLAYNSIFILKSFLHAGFKVTNKSEFKNHKEPPINKIKLMNFHINPKVSHILISAQKFIWLDGSKSNLNYIFDEN